MNQLSQNMKTRTSFHRNWPTVFALFAWLYPAAITAEEKPFSDDQWASAFSASLPLVHNFGIDATVADSQGNVYVAGAFEAIGTVAAHNIAKWDGQSWSPLGEGVDGTITDLAIAGEDLYAAVWDTIDPVARRYIVKWDGQSWFRFEDTFGEEDDAPAFPNLLLASSGSELYVAGPFTSVEDVSAKHIARWNGSSWSSLGDGVEGAIQVVAVAEGVVYVAENLGSPRDRLASRIIRWDGSQWEPLGSGFDGEVHSIAVSDEDIYVSGSFSKAGQKPVSNVVRWRDNKWSDFGGGFDGSPAALLTVGSDLYVANRQITKWDGQSWSALGTGVDYRFGGMVSGSERVDSLVMTWNGRLYAAGSFAAIDGVNGSNIASWDGDSWSALGMNGAGIIADPGRSRTAAIEALEVVGNDLYLAGSFSINSHANHMAKWEGPNRGSPLGAGVNDQVFAMASAGTDLYAGGNFTAAGDHEANHIARWDGTAWSRLGGGTDGAISALATSGSDVYAGGYFTSADGVEANHIAKWNGSSWEALGSGLERRSGTVRVYAIAVAGDDLYVAGKFDQAGDEEVHNIAKWSGSSWSALGSGTNDTVWSLVALGDDLYVGGSFSKAGGVDANHIAKWDGQQWSALGAGFDSGVLALTVSDGHLYAGGYFVQSGEVETRSIAKWNGVSWSPLGSGFRRGSSKFYKAGVKALAVKDNELFVGGEFTFVGGKVSSALARAFLTDVPAVEFHQGYHKTIFFRGISSGHYRIECSGDLRAWEDLGVRYAGETGGIDFEDRTPLVDGYYRAVRIGE